MLRQFLRSIEGDKQVVFHLPPIEGRGSVFVVILFVGQKGLLVAQLEEPIGVLWLGTRFRRNMDEHGDEPGLLSRQEQVARSLHFCLLLIQFVPLLSLPIGFLFGYQRLLQHLPGGLRHFRQVTLQLNVQMKTLQQHPAAKLVLAILCGSGEANGEVRPHQFHILLAFFGKFLAGHLLPLFDFAFQQFVASSLHPVGPAVQMREPFQQADFRRLATAELVEHGQRLGFGFRRPGLSNELIKELPLHLRARLVIGPFDPQPQESDSSLGTRFLMNIQQHAVKRRRTAAARLLLFPAGLNNGGHFFPELLIWGMAIVLHVINQIVELAQFELIGIRQ